MIEVRHELMQELKANSVGRSQLKARQSQQAKAKVANSFAGPSRLPNIRFVGEDAINSFMSFYFQLKVVLGGALHFTTY
jgi:hypothetical protein